MVSDMNYSTVSNVIASWDSLRRIPDYRRVAGLKLFRGFFSRAPSGVAIYSFNENQRINDKLFRNPRMIQHATHFIQMLDQAISLLGPDIETLTEILIDLGESHVRYGVKPHMYGPMGEALIETLGDMLGDQFTDEIKASWIEVYQAFSYDMIRGART
mmetsp:Transcript_7010/g.19031  ORF Transcript_7010/g.19031 Transcript_7010/m.19031 type:complete len:158 (+) Transcript_7010:364-837(+)